MNYVVYIFKSTRGAGGGGGYIENMKKIFPFFKRLELTLFFSFQHI